jgi:predicted lipoprotein with Yx(FWY)xxD motif
MSKHFGATLSALALAVVVSGCAGGSGTTTTASPPPASEPSATVAPASSAPMTSAQSADGSAASGSTAPAQAADLKTAATTAGQAVVDAQGMSVYVFTKDTKDAGTSACTGSCAATWPPVLTGSAAPVAEGVTAKLGTIATPDGKKQLTINGMPLYHFAKDHAAGDIAGQGVGGLWYLVDPAGDMTKPAAVGGY